MWQATLQHLYLNVNTIHLIWNIKAKLLIFEVKTEIWKRLKEKKQNLKIDSLFDTSVFLFWVALQSLVWKQSQEEVQNSSVLSNHLNYNMLKNY